MFKRIKKTIGKQFLDSYKRRIQKAFDPSLDHCLSTIRIMLKKSKYCFLITHGENKWPSARMVQPIVDFETLDIWLGTNPTLRKVREIKKNQNVTLAFGSTWENANLILYGQATLVTDIKERVNHWIGSWIMFFPGGPGAENFVSIKVEALEIELMNFKQKIVDEPFGLRPVRIVRKNGEWQISD